MKDNCGVKISNLPENILKIIYYYSPWFYSEKDHKRGLIASVEKKLKNKIKYDEIKLSSLLKASNLRNIDEDNWLYIIDDLKWKEWEKHSNHLVSNFFIPLFYGNNPILFISPHINKFNKSSVINPEDVHSHWKIPTSVLAIEQMNFLINAKGINTNPDFSYYYDWIDENVKKWYREDSTRGKSIKIENDIIKILHPFHKEWYYVSNFKLNKENSKMGEKEFSYTDFYNEKNANDGNKNTTQPVNIDVKAALDEYQYKAVLAANAPVQVLAPAGSGKTRTLIYRIINLIQKGTRADRILALAFNRKAMLEMRERLEEMGINGVKIFTLHAYGLKILKHFLKDWKFSEEDDKNQNIRSIVLSCLKKDHHFLLQRDHDVLIDFIDAVQHVKSTLFHPSEIKLKLDEVEINFEKLFNNILKKQNKQKFFEFSDMIYLAIRLLFKNPEFRQWLQMQQQYVLVDEFQDLNASQIMMVDILSRPWRNLFVVGDDDQLIYGWRGAETEHILKFNDRFGYYKRYILNYNYRSKRSLVLQTRQLIHYNKNRVEKKILPKNFDLSNAIKIITGNDIWDEAQKIVNKVERLIKNGIPPGDIALLSRFNAYLFVLSLLMERKGIKHEIPDPAQLLQTIAGRDFIAYFTLAVMPEKAEPWMLKRALKRPNKYLTNDFIKKVNNINELANKGTGYLKEWQWERIIMFIENFNYLGHLRKGGMTPENFIKEMIKVFELDFLYEDDMGEVQYDRSSELAVLEIFQLMSKPFKKVEDYLIYLKNLGKMKPVSKNNNNLVHLTTIHRTKGNEYPIVFLFHLNDSADLSKYEYKTEEEERRVSYVAATRAIEKLYISVSDKEEITHLTELMKPIFLNSKKKINLKTIKKEERKKLKKVINDMPESSIKGKLQKLLEEINETVEIKTIQNIFQIPDNNSKKINTKSYQALIEILDRQFLLNKYDEFLNIRREMSKKH